MILERMLVSSCLSPTCMMKPPMMFLSTFSTSSTSELALFFTTSKTLLRRSSSSPKAVVITAVSIFLCVLYCSTNECAISSRAYSLFLRMMMPKKANVISLASLKIALSTCSFLSPLMMGLLSTRLRSRFSLQACLTFFISAYTLSSWPFSRERSNSDLAYLDATFVPCISFRANERNLFPHSFFLIQIHIIQQAFHQLLLFFGG